MKKTKSEAGRLGALKTHRERIEAIDALRKFTNKSQLDDILHENRPTSTRTLKAILAVVQERSQL